MPSNGLIGCLVISFVPGSPWHMALAALIELLCVLHETLLIFGSSPVHLLILVVERLSELGVSLVVQIVHLRLVLLAPVEGARGFVLCALRLEEARAVAAGTKLGRRRCSLLVQLLQLLLLACYLVLVVINAVAYLIHVVHIHVSSSIISREVQGALRAVVD